MHTKPSLRFGLRMHAAVMLNYNYQKGVAELKIKKHFCMANKSGLFFRVLLIGIILNVAASCDSNSEVREYYESGKLKKVYEATSGTNHGTSITYYENGNVESIENYEHGSANGEQIKYYPNGTKENVSYYFEGKLYGLASYYDSMGVLESQITFREHSPNGRFRKYFPDGSKKAEGTFKNGKVAGMFMQYDSLGNRIATCNFDSLGKELGCEYFLTNTGGGPESH